MQQVAFAPLPYELSVDGLLRIPTGMTIEEEEEFISTWELKNEETVKRDHYYRFEVRKAFAVLMKKAYKYPVSRHLANRIARYDSIDGSLLQNIQNDNEISLKINELYRQALNGVQLPHFHISDDYLSDVINYVFWALEWIWDSRYKELRKKIDLITTLDKVKQVRSSPLKEENGVLGKVIKYVRKDDEFKPISSFTMKPVEAISVPDQGEYVKVELISQSKRQCEVTLPPDSWLSSQKFLKSLPSKEFIFTGSGPDVQLLRSHIASFDMPHKKGVTVAGFHNGSFVTEDGALGASGLNNDLVLLTEQRSNCGILNQPLYQKGKESLAGLKQFNAPGVVMPILGWTVACFLKPRILKILGGFPVLCIFGEPGAGKTSTLRSVISRVWSERRDAHALSQQTDFTLMKFVAGSNCIPLLLEENKRSMQDDRLRVTVSNLIRSAYNSLEGQRGRADQTLVNYKYEAPVAIVGETGFSEAALLDRMVIIQMSKRDSQPNKKQFDAVQKMPLECIGRTILDRALRMPDEEVKKILLKERDAVDSKLLDRPRDNAAVCRFGLRILGEVTGIEFTEKDFEAIDKTVFAGISEDGRERKSSVDKILEAMGSMSGFNNVIKLSDARKRVEVRSYSFTSDHLKPFVHYQSDGEYLRLWLAGSYPVFLKWARIHGFDGDLLDEASFKKHLQKEPYYLKNVPVKIGKKTRRALVLDINKLMKKGVEIPDEWLNEGEPDNDD